MYTAAADPMAWGPGQPYMLQMVPVPVMGGPAAGFGAAPMDPAAMQAAMGMVAQAGMQEAYQMQPESQGLAGAMSMGLKYPSDKIVLAAGQYREVQPMVSPALMQEGPFSFKVEPPDLPPGLQLDPSTGIIWGTPVPPSGAADPAGPYRPYTVTFTSPTASASTALGIKVVHFTPEQFRIAHVSQLEKNKYMVLVNTRKK